GFFAADGNAAETSADVGNTWKVRFRPDATGTWNYTVSFLEGENIVVKDDGATGESLPMDGANGSFEIEESDKTGDDFRAKGRIVNGGDGYFEFQETGDVWIKNGADSPENFLAFAGFDQTSRFSLKTEVREGEADPKESLHKYEPHVSDWKAGDPVWQDEKGKGIIGALNYLSSQGVNSVYMLTMNILGDGKDVWPYTSHNERYRFDCSKLDQWEIVFDHMDNLGMMQHFVLQETENECLLDMGYTDVQRKIYLRELIARFGHHPAVTWNMGEENGPTDWSPIGQTHEQKVAMANYLKATNPYPNIVVVHTHADDHHQNEYLEPFLGFENFDGPSMQIGNPYRVHQRMKKWVNESEQAGKRWLVNLDEIGPHWKGVMPDSHDLEHDTVRHHCLWGALMAGGTGVEWYFGYRYPHNDLGLEDFRSRHNWWKQSTLATDFFSKLPVESMKSTDELINIEDGYCFSNPGEIYVVYLPSGQANCSLKIDSKNSFSVKWFNPREGGEMQAGNVTEIKGPGNVELGNPPAEAGSDWVVIVR
ncbi:MAG TPA: putative collagen-binding domain-containing protein, partial [Tangfeifania sp.]|nr:putative collagen-binding domain-containing protein [Tangfeifania sp.]